MNVPVFSSYIRRRDMDAVLNRLVTDDLGPGAAYQSFMEQAQGFFAQEASVGLRSPLEALDFALAALGLDEGAGVIISAYSPSYYEYVLRRRSLRSLIADVIPSSGSIDPAQVVALSQEGARALVIHSPMGLMPDFEALKSLGLPIIEDISHSLGAKRGERSAGENGDLCVLSMESGGIITSGEGALVLARGKREAAVIRNMAGELPRELFMSDMNAALGQAQLRDLGKFQERRREFFGLFQRAVMQSRHGLLSQDGEGEPSYYALPLILQSGAKEVCAYAKKKEIETELAFSATIAGSGRLTEGQCPQAAALALRCVAFPLHPRIGKADAQRIAKVLATLP